MNGKTNKFFFFLQKQTKQQQIIKLPQSHRAVVEPFNIIFSGMGTTYLVTLTVPWSGKEPVSCLEKIVVELTVTSKSLAFPTAPVTSADGTPFLMFVAKSSNRGRYPHAPLQE